MEQQFILKEHGGFSLTELNHMTGEERQWWINRLQQKQEQEADAAKNTAGPDHSIPPSPGKPPPP